MNLENTPSQAESRAEVSSGDVLDPRIQAMAWDAPTAFRGYGLALQQLFWATVVLIGAVIVSATPMLSTAFKIPINVPGPIVIGAMFVAIGAVFWELQSKYKCLEFKLPLSFSKLLVFAVYAELALMLTRWFLRRALPDQVSKVLMVVLFSLSIILFVWFLAKMADLIGRIWLSRLANGIIVSCIGLLVGYGSLALLKIGALGPRPLDPLAVLGIIAVTLGMTVFATLGYIFLLFGLSRSLLTYSRDLQETIDLGDDEAAESPAY